METDPDQMPDEGENGDSDPDKGMPGMPEQPTPDQQRGAPDEGGGTTAPVPGNPDVGGS